MKVVNERSTLAAYDVGMRAQAQLRDTAAPRRERITQALAQVASPRQPGKLADLSLQLNRQSSALESAQFYLSEVAEHMTGLKRKWDNRMGQSLVGRKVLIVGAGDIGQTVAKFLLPFGVEIGRASCRERV